MEDKDSLNKRYLFKLSANFIGFTISIITQMVIPRGLGPKAYGDFNFLTGFFNEIISFLDMGTSTGFYVKLSQRQKDHGLVSFYLYFTMIVFTLLSIFVVLTYATSTYTLFWPAQGLMYVFMSAFLCIVTWVVRVLNKMTDAYGLTVPSEMAGILQKALGLALILILFFAYQLNLAIFFFHQYFVFLFMGAAFIIIIKGNSYSFKQKWRLSSEQIRQYTKEFYEYNHPLFVYAVVAMIVGILDRWLLQYFAGSVQQGFFGLSYQIGATCLLFSNAMAPLLMREFSIAYGKQDMNEIARLFRQYIPILYSLAAYFSCFISVQASKVVYIFAADNYKESVTTVALMALFPIHQTYGRLGGSVFFATGQTVIYRNIGTLFMLMGLPATFFLIAPERYYGLNAGSTGLAIKMVALQFIVVNVQLYYNARFLNLSFWKYLVHQLINICSLLAIAFIAKNVVDYYLLEKKGVILNFIIAGFLYTVLVGVVSYWFPRLFGLKQQDFRYLKYFPFFGSSRGHR